MPVVSCLIVDDESHCRSHLRYMLAAESGIDVVGEADTVISAVHAVQALKPDLLLLDVQLRAENGFSVLSHLQAPPQVIFTTGYDHFAVRAFDVAAVDYLLKPVTQQRLRKALSKLASYSQPATVAAAAECSKKDEIELMPIGASGFFIPRHDILLIEARNHHSKLILDSGRSYVVRRSLREWSLILPATTFLPLDRSTLINVDRIQAIECSSRGGTVTTGSLRCEFIIGRAAAGRLRLLLHGTQNIADN